MTFDDYFARRFNRQTYNCLHFARDVWLDVTGVDLTGRLDGLLGAVAGRRVSRDHPAGFVRLARPSSPCLALFQRPRSTPHVGIYLRGRVLHIHERGVEYQPIDVAMRGFATVRYYTCNG